ncbi:RteC domain-containing protein [Flavobacteriaceae bacterium S0862]|nr:RteC domain-containing protein [Flavobacteriaceae bacterium S0862]
MIPKELKKTYQLQEELNGLKAKNEFNILRQENHLLADQLKAVEHLKDIYDDQPEEQYKKQINESCIIEYKQLNNAKSYFLGCSLETYSSTYKNRLKAFKLAYIDAAEHNFIYDELNSLIHFNLPYYIDKKLVKSINYSIERTKEFLINKLEDQGFEVTYSINKAGIETLSIKTNQKDLSIKKIDNSILKWNRSNTDIMELAKALYDSNCVENISQTQFFELFLNFFNIHIKDPYPTLTKIRSRVKDKLTLIPQLETAMIKWIEESQQNKGEY